MINSKISVVETVRALCTPTLSGDEDSDSGIKSKSKRHTIHDVVSENSSPIPRRSNNGPGGITKLKMQLEALGLQNSKRCQSPEEHGLSAETHLQSVSGKTSATSETTYSDNEESDISSCEDASESELSDKSKENCTRYMSASDFKPLRCLGKGTFGTVLLVKEETTGRLYAQKQFKKASITVHKRLVQQTKAERSILESVKRHPFVVKLFYAFQDEEKLYLILEYAQGGELFTHLMQAHMFSEPVAAFYMAEMVLALDYLHCELGVIYRDLKPENCLLDSEGHLLLTDFGLSKISADDKCNSILGTVEYMAPEVVLGQEYGKAVDWWSLGALGFDLLTGSPPFKGQNHVKIRERIAKQKIQMPYFLSPDAKDLLTRFLRKEPTKRLGSNMPKDMQTIKKHRFFRKIDWKLLAKREVEPPIQPIITDPELAENFAQQFTHLPLSPVVVRNEHWERHQGKNTAITSDSGDNLFCGFSYVASSSLLERAFGASYLPS
ncbi:Serine/threonine-protein kinase [Podosphaera aphanis]|nr:Serine/threonine-protein kinase [Podosphaera aphanis]